MPVHRRKAVVKSWHNNGEPASVSGKFEFLQQTKYDVTNIDISIEGLVDTRGYHIHMVSTIILHFFTSQRQPLKMSI